MTSAVAEIRALCNDRHDAALGDDGDELSVALLVVNVGSTSVKVAYFPRDDSAEPVWRADTPLESGSADRVAMIRAAIAQCPAPLTAVSVVGHRIVHGGPHFDAPAVIDADVEAAITQAAVFAPLHNEAGLDGVRAARSIVGRGVAHVAVFDTAFHHSIPLANSVYGGPYEWVASGLRRYGFHGISHEHAARVTALLVGRPVTELALVTCHLGGGCSITAVDGGRSIDTTMGLTPLDGLIMATRSGSVDPALVLHLLRTGTTVDQLEDVLNQHSGLAGLSGVSGDLVRVLAARDAGDDRAGLAVDAFVHRAAAAVGAMTAALGRIDGLVFTGGIGEHSAEIRARVCAPFAFAGIDLDETRNRAAQPDSLLSHAGAPVIVALVVAREEQAIAEACRAAVARTI